MARKTVSSLLLLAVLAAAPPATAQHYAVEAGAETTLLEVHSRARLESFSGKSRSLSGHFELDENGCALAGEMSFDLRDLDTGLGLRNRHMHENVLHTDQHPTATLVVTGCEPDEGDHKRLRAELDLHGVTRPIEVLVDARSEGGALLLRAEFEVTLADFEIPRPRMLMLKVAETVQIVVEALALPASPPERSE